MQWSNGVRALVGDYFHLHSFGDTLIYIHYNGTTRPQCSGNVELHYILWILIVVFDQSCVFFLFPSFLTENPTSVGRINSIIDQCSQDDKIEDDDDIDGSIGSVSDQHRLIVTVVYIVLFEQNEVRIRLFASLGSHCTLQRPIWTSSGHSRANTACRVASRLRRFLPRCGHANWESELFVNVVPRTFDLT